MTKKAHNKYLYSGALLLSALFMFIIVTNIQTSVNYQIIGWGLSIVLLFVAGVTQKKQNLLFWFVYLVLLYFLAGMLSERILSIDEILLSSLSEQLTALQIEKIIDFRERWRWIGYALIPLLLLLKISVIALLIDLGCFFYNKRIAYKQLFAMVLRAEYIFLLVPIAKVAWFYFFKTDYTFEDFQYFYPFSAISVVGHKGLDIWFIYPLQVFNLFEIVYWFYLASQIDKALDEKEEKGINILASGYGSGLLLWIVAVMFFTLNNS